MSLGGTQEIQYGELAKDILDKIIITSKKGFSLVIFALKTTVLGERAKSYKRIPQAILEKVEQLSDLIRNKHLMDPDE